MAKKKKEDKNMAEESVLESLELEVTPDTLVGSDEALEQLVTEEPVPEEVIPARTDPAWHDFVMSKFMNDEMMDNSPSADGLRRVAELLLGEITSSITTVVEAAGERNGNRATVVVNVTFEDGKTYSGAADSAPDNTDDVFRRYPTAIAETRAEGRALRKALKLRKVVSAEETSLIAREDTAGGGFMKIDIAQVKGINLTCKRLDVNVEKFINMGTKKYDDIRDVEFETAIKMLQELNRYGVDPVNNPDSKPVPDAIRGYVDGWQTKE